MKMHRQDYLAMREAIRTYFACVDFAALAADYKNRDLSDMRFRWDALHASRFPTNGLYYAGLKDEHIDTALRRIVKELNTAG